MYTEIVLCILSGKINQWYGGNWILFFASTGLIGRDRVNFGGVVGNANVGLNMSLGSKGSRPLTVAA